MPDIILHHSFRCTFHLFTQVWRGIKFSNLSAEGQTLLKFLEKWVMTWVSTVKKPYQYDDSFKKFKDLLQTKRSVLGGAYMKVDSLISSMENSSSSWALCFKKHIMDLEQHTTSIGESFNASLKKHKTGSMASLTLANSAVTCIHHSDTLLKKRKMDNSINHNKFRDIQFGDTSLNLLTRKAQDTIEELIEQKV